MPNHSYIKKGSFTPWLMVLPAMVIIGVFGTFPFFYALHLSTVNDSIDNQSEYTIGRYSEAFEQQSFKKSVSNTLWFTGGTLIPVLAFSLTIAIGLHRAARFKKILNTLYFLPYITSIVAAALVWRSFLDPTQGITNDLFLQWGWEPQRWLLEPKGIFHMLFPNTFAPSTGPSLSLCCVIVFEIWHSTGFMIVILLAALSVIPKELEEAVRLEGGSEWTVTRHVVVPFISPTLLFLTIVGTIGSFQAFSSLYALTGDGRGPLDTTQTLTVYIFTQFYEYGRIGYGAAVAVLLTLALMVLTVVQWQISKRRTFDAS
jgi:multiple sugar transport system permease protein